MDGIDTTRTAGFARHYLRNPLGMAAGLETLRQVKTQVSVPVVAIGGINADNVAEVVSAGADAVAVISAVLGAEGVTEASRRLAAGIEEG